MFYNCIKIKYYLFVFFLPLILSSQEILVKPYLQNTTSNSIVIMWEIFATDGYLEWGTSEELGNTTYVIGESSENGNYIFTATITNLNPNTKYYYRSVNNNTYSETYSFYTEDVTENEASTKMVVMSDMQYDSSFPN